ncbi:MAG: hypothetical protein ACRC80_00265 [Waterburya sp.]
MFERETFSKNGNAGVRVKYSFTPNNNANGVYFNPLSVFTQEAATNSKTDRNHNFEYETFSNESTTTLSEAKVKGTVISYDAIFESTNPLVVEVVTSDSFKGFSPTLTPVAAPTPSRSSTPRFYKDGDLTLEGFSILDNQTPAFAGADKVQVETFSKENAVYINEETFSEVEKQEANKEKEKLKKETFYAYCDVGEWVKTLDGKFGKVIKIEDLENSIRNITLKDIKGSETIISTTSTDSVRVLNNLRISDIFDYILSYFTETFATGDQEEDVAAKLLANIPTNDSKKTNQNNAFAEKFGKSANETVLKPTQEVITSLFKKIKVR